MFVCLFVCLKHVQWQVIGKEKRRNKWKHNQGMRGRTIIEVINFAVIHSFLIMTEFVRNRRTGKGFEPYNFFYIPLHYGFCAS